MAPDELESPPAPPPSPPVRYRIAAPGPVSGGVMGVGFANGHALINDPVRHARALAWFQAEPGYHVEAIDPPADEPDPEPVSAVEDPVPDATPASKTDEDSEEQPWL